MKKVLLLMAALWMTVACQKEEEFAVIEPLNVTIEAVDDSKLMEIIENDITNSIKDTSASRSGSNGDPHYDYTDTFEHRGMTYGRYREDFYSPLGAKLYRVYNTFEIVVVNFTADVYFEWVIDADGRRYTNTFDNVGQMEFKFRHDFAPKVTLTLNEQDGNQILVADWVGFDQDNPFTSIRWSAQFFANGQIRDFVTGGGLTYTVPTEVDVHAVELTLSGDYDFDTANTLFDLRDAANSTEDPLVAAWQILTTVDGLSEVTFDQYCRWIEVYEAGLELETSEFFPGRYNPLLVEGLTSDHHHYVVLLKLLDDDDYEFRYVDGTGLGDSRDISYSSPEEFFVNLYNLQILPDYQPAPCGDETADETGDDDTVAHMPYSFDFLGLNWIARVNANGTYSRIGAEGSDIVFTNVNDAWSYLGNTADFGDQDAIQLIIAQQLVEDVSVEWTDEANGWDIPSINFPGGNNQEGLTMAWFTHNPSVVIIAGNREDFQPYTDGRISSEGGQHIFRNILPQGRRLTWRFAYNGTILKDVVHYDRPRVVHGAGTYYAVDGAANGATVDRGFRVYVNGEAAHVPNQYNPAATTPYRQNFTTNCASLASCAFNGQGNANLRGNDQTFSFSLYSRTANGYVRDHTISYAVKLTGTNYFFGELTHAAGNTYNNAPRITNVDFNGNSTVDVNETYNFNSAVEYAVTDENHDPNTIPTDWHGSSTGIPYTYTGPGHYTVWARTVGSKVRIATFVNRNFGRN